MNIKLTDTIDSIVSRNLKAAKILSRQGIDLCADGGRSLKDACQEANISFRVLLRNIKRAEFYRNDPPPDVETLQIDELTRFVERYHHLYANENITFIKPNLARLVRVYGKQHPELEELNNIFHEMTAHLTIHMQHEEQIVFPYIRIMAKRGKRVTSAIYRSVGSPITAMVAEHQNENPYITRLEALTHHYAVPFGSGNAYKITFEMMKDFEKDLQEHLRIENEILFPKALEMEARFRDAEPRGRKHYRSKIKT